MQPPVAISVPQLPSTQSPADFLLRLLDRHRKILLSALVLFYLAGFNGQWRPEPDSALYLCLGRSLAEGHGYTYFDQPHRLAYPGLPLLLASTFKLFGTQTLWPAELLMLLLALAGLALVYRLFYLHDGRATAVLMTCGVGLTRTYFRQAFQIMTDLPFLIGVMLFLVGYEALKQSLSRRQSSKWYDWLMFFAGVAFAALMRPAIFALAPVVVLAIADLIFHLQGKRKFFAVILSLAMIALAISFFLFDRGIL